MIRVAIYFEYRKKYHDTGFYLNWVQLIIMKIFCIFLE